MDEKPNDGLLKKAFFYLSFRSRTEREMLVYLQKKAREFNLKSSEVSQTIKYLKSKNFINDKNFVDEYINSRLRSKPRSLYLIKQELKSKNIPEKDIEDYLSKNSVDEFSAAENLLNRKLYKWEKLPHFKKKEKVYYFLKSKGFSFDVIRSVFEKVCARK